MSHWFPCDAAVLCAATWPPRVFSQKIGEYLLRDQGVSGSGDCERSLFAMASSCSASASEQVSKIDTAWSKTAEAKRQPRLKVCTDLEEQVKRCLRDHFPHWSAELVHGVEVDGYTLKERLLADKAIWNEDKRALPMGGPYFQNLRNKYGGGQTIETCLAADPSLAVSQEMRMAAIEAFERPARRSRMLQYLACATDANQAEVVGACRWVCRLKPTVTEQLHCCVEVMRFICRLGLDASHSAEMKLMRPKFEEVLLQARLSDTAQIV